MRANPGFIGLTHAGRRVRFGSDSLCDEAPGQRIRDNPAPGQGRGRVLDTIFIIIKQQVTIYLPVSFIFGLAGFVWWA